MAEPPTLNRSVELTSVPQRAGSIPAGATTLHEVWLIDTGLFIDMTATHPAWSQEPRWVKRMERRRVMRMFIPRDELAALPGLERDFTIVKRFFEMRAAVNKGRPVAEQYRVLMERCVDEADSPIKQIPTEEQA